MDGDRRATKRCTRCGEDKPDDDYYVKDKATGRRFSWCKECHNARKKEDYRRRKAGLPAPPRPVPIVLAERICRVCSATKPIEAFRQHRQTCRACEIEAGRVYRAQHPDRLAETQRSFRERHREQLREAGRERYASDLRYGPGKQCQWRAEHPEASRGHVKAYKGRNPERNAIGLARRRARIIGNGGDITAQEWAALKALYGYQCLRCKRPEPEIVLTLDHIVPLIKGGLHIIENAQPLCKPCNSWKNVRIIDFRP